LLSTHKLLTKNPNAAFALSLILLSDDKRSDGDLNSAQLVQAVEELTKKFGCCFTLKRIGIASAENFILLRWMAE
jgi:hypothetical protein